MKRNVRFDPELSHYEGFFEKEWAEELWAITKRTKLEQITFNFTTSWWATSSARRLPFVLVESVKSYAEGFFKECEPVPVVAIRALAESIANETEERLVDFKESNRTILHSILVDKFEKATEAIKNFSIGAFSETVWDNLIEINSIKAALWASETSVYTKIYFDYEGYLSESLRILTGTDKLFSSQLIQELENKLGRSIKEFCYCDEPIEIARLIRNAIAHNNHKKTTPLATYEQKLRDQDMLEGEQIIILARHTTALYNLLKERALSFAKEMVKRPEIKP